MDKYNHYKNPSYTSIDIEEKIELESGTSTNPSLHFENSIGSGLYEIGSNNIGMAISGVKQTEWNGINGFMPTGKLSFPETNSIKSITPDSNSKSFNLINSTGNYVLQVDDDDSTKLITTSGDLFITGGLNMNSLKLGSNAGLNQASSAIAIGTNSGNGQSFHSVAIGTNCGQTNQLGYNVALGYNCANLNQGLNSVAIGPDCGSSNQGGNSVCIGVNSGTVNQGARSVALGSNSGKHTQGVEAIALGNYAGYYSQGSRSIALGNSCGYTSQGTGCIAIGDQAGYSNQHDNSIIINGSGQALESAYNNSFYVADIRNDVSSNLLAYNDTSKEITYTNSPSFEKMLGYTPSDLVYPTLQFLNDTHDNVYINFDSHYTGSVWSSSSSASNYQLMKSTQFYIRYDSGNALGGDIGWTTALSIDTSGTTATKILEPIVTSSYSLGTSAKRWTELWITTGVINTSDVNAKDNIIDLPFGLDFINTLRPVSYKLKNYTSTYEEKGENQEVVIKTIDHVYTRTHTGLIAQEVKANMDTHGINTAMYIDPAVNDPNDTSNKGLRYEELIAPMIKAIQELTTMNALLTARVEALEAM